MMMRCFFLRPDPEGVCHLVYQYEEFIATPYGSVAQGCAEYIHRTQYSVHTPRNYLRSTVKRSTVFRAQPPIAIALPAPASGIPWPYSVTRSWANHGHMVSWSRELSNALYEHPSKADSIASLAMQGAAPAGYVWCRDGHCPQINARPF